MGECRVTWHWYIDRYHGRRVFAAYCLAKWRHVGSERNVALSVRHACLVYHSSRPGTRHREVLRKFDHAAIYLHIAGSYSPIMLVSLREAGYWGWGIFCFVWLCALVGTTLCFCRLKEHSYLETICYVAMGCSIFVAFKPLCDHIPSLFIYWLIAEGISYITGTVFYSFHKLPYMHSVFHLFVLGGTICHMIALWYIL